MRSKLVKMQAAVVLGCVLVMGTACGDKANQKTGSAADQEIEIAEVAVPKSAVPQMNYVKVPTNPGVTVYNNDKAAIDASNINQGYVSVKYIGGHHLYV